MPTVLIVDDDLEMRAMLRDVLVRSGFHVEEAASSDELRRLPPRVEPAAIILDHEMPGDWGLEVLPALRKTYPEAAVVFTTAFGGPAMWEAAERAGAAACLSKPFRMGDLLATVRRVLALDPLDCDLSAS
jgi:DNA-binding NtrC family response regulator